MSAARKALHKKARRQSVAFPVATIASYGPTDQFATKVAVGIVDAHEKIIALERWFTTTRDARQDEDICRQIVAFIERHNVYRVAMTDRIIGCPHEEGIDYPEGESCPQCPFWKGRDRWTGQPLN
jgi:hypothetical protein